MAASDEFRTKLREGKIVDALTLALEESIELKITTWVSSSNLGSQGVVVDKPEPGYCIRTRLNLVDGDVENEVGTQFIGNSPYVELREFHQQQVREGRQIVQQNLENLQQMLVVMTQTLNQLRKNSRTSSQPGILSPSDLHNSDQS